MQYPVMYAVGTVLTFIITVLAERKLIPVLASKKMGQKILEIGPRWHKGKEGTPIMGGVIFIISTAAAFLKLAPEDEMVSLASLVSKLTVPVART